MSTELVAILSQKWLSTLTEGIHLVGQFITERNHGVDVDYLCPSCAGDLQQESWALGYLSSATVRCIWHLALRVCYRD